MSNVDQIWRRSLSAGVAIYKSISASVNVIDEFLKDDIMNSLSKLASIIPRYSAPEGDIGTSQSLSIALGKAYRIETLMLITNDVYPETFSEKELDMINEIQKLIYEERARIEPIEYDYPPNYELIRAEVFGVE